MSGADCSRDDEVVQVGVSDSGAGDTCGCAPLILSREGGHYATANQTEGRPNTTDLKGGFP